METLWQDLRFGFRMLRKKLNSSKRTQHLRRKLSNRARPEGEGESETDEETDQEIVEETDKEQEDAESYLSDNDESRVLPRSWRSLGEMLRFRRSTTSKEQA